jgi:glucose/arabinose dehydrogenase
VKHPAVVHALPHYIRAGLVVACLAAACTEPPSPPAEPPAQGERITGSERIGFDQLASDATDLAAIRYAIYVDGARSELTGVSCATTASSAGFACTAALPRLSAGSHSLQLASFTFTIEGMLLESSRSAPLVVVVSATAGQLAGTTALSDTKNARDEAGASNRRPVARIATLDGVRLALNRVAGGLNMPADLAFAPDGRLFIAERSGRVRSVQRAGLAAEPMPPIDEVALSGDGGLLSIALDPAFERTHWVYAIYTTPSRSGAPVFRVARFREVRGVLAERAVLLDDIPVSPIRPAASIRFGGDGKLYIAIDDGGSVRSPGDLASLNGKILRLNADGTTPRDQSNPVYSVEHRSPRGFDWHPTQVLWIVGGVTPESVRASAITDTGPPRRGAVRSSYELSSASGASSITFYRGGLIPSFRDNLLVASRNEGAGLLRIRIDPDDATRMVSVERLLENQLGAVRALTVGPDGAIYLGTADALLRLSPE